MKRARDSIDSPRSQTQSRRQEPVSCQFCRLKKLRCSRESPCSNCAARNIGCVHVTPRATNATPNATPSATGLIPNGLSLQSLHTRIQRIENALALRSDGPVVGVPTERVPLSSRTTPQVLEPNHGIEKDQMDLEGVEMTTRIARSVSRFQPGIDTSQFFQLWPSSPETHFASSQWFELLPAYERAVQLLEFYAHDVCWTYHFVHLPTLRRQLQQTYEQLGRGLSPEPSVLALICAVFALAKYFTHQSTSALENMATLGEQGYGEFVSLASRALAEARHLDNPTVESIQAVLLLASSLLLNKGAMTAFRLLLTAMFVSAQVLLIHQIDSPKNQGLRQNGSYNRVELEIKRRIWWHIASSDWIFAFMSGMQTETYVVHSHRMHVNLPSNADDAAISPDHCPDEPLTVPTEMTYFLFRCRLSIIFHEFMDAVAEKGLGLDEVEYEQVLAFDRKINNFIDSVPYFLKTDPESRQRCVELDQQRPYLICQRLMAQFGASTRMSGLHRPYIARGARDPKYAYSRMVCLKSARTVLEFEKVMRTEIPRSMMMPDPGKIWAMMYQVFFATVVLIMDYHFNKDEPRAEERIEEIMDCCRRLEAAKAVSTIAARGLEELKHVMRKWGLLTDVTARPTSREKRQEGVGDSMPWSTASPNQAESGHLREQETPAVNGDEFATSSWMDSWDFNVELDIPQWNAIFQDLESRSGMF